MTIKVFIGDCELKFEKPREGDAGFDLRSAIEISINPKSSFIIPTKITLSIPNGFVGIIKDRSSMAIKKIYTPCRSN